MAVNQKRSKGRLKVNIKSIDDAPPQEWDHINNPPHYNHGDIECIEYIKQQLGDRFTGYLEGNVIKYLHRYRHKNKSSEDLEKANWYLKRLQDEL